MNPSMYAKAMAKVERRFDAWNPPPTPGSAEEGNTLLRKALLGPDPVFVGRLGTTEGNNLGWYLRFYRPFRLPFPGTLKEGAWTASGFFPPTTRNLARLGSLFVEALSLTDIYASWKLSIDGQLVKTILRGRPLIPLDSLEAHGFEDPWTSALEGRRVLVVHPFATTIAEQYRNHRTQLHANPRVLPPFDLVTVKAHQTHGGGGNTAGFSSWFEAFDDVRRQVDQTDFDVALVAAGSYGMPLCAHIRKQGKKVIYVGGVLQVLFGVRGGRWDSQPGLYNEFWRSPDPSDRPNNWRTVENGCYW